MKKQKLKEITLELVEKSGKARFMKVYMDISKWRYWVGDCRNNKPNKEEIK